MCSHFCTYTQLQIQPLSSLSPTPYPFILPLHPLGHLAPNFSLSPFQVLEFILPLTKEARTGDLYPQDLSMEWIKAVFKWESL